MGVLRDTGELLRLLDSVCAVSPIDGLTDSESDRLWWVTAAEFALRVGKDPVRYFRFVVQRDRRDLPKLVDEDAAIRRLKEIPCPT